ncbi:hypothetical protein DPMN_043103 [Dreissena polymorpha]|uniref:Uncharacterized protein n=1 Tax=Dreissena polymorpha TaxID=45954 RepID=A0A9D4D0B3_DREPO|nr:hypothetical protein DPMN_043103 [Dreissena polymorpha]
MIILFNTIAKPRLFWRRDLENLPTIKKMQVFINTCLRKMSNTLPIRQGNL